MTPAPPPPPPPPVLDSVSPAAAQGGATLTLSGSSFSPETPESDVQFRVPGGPVVTGQLTNWTDTQITVKLPPLATIGSGGPLEVLVQTAGGTSAPAALTLLEDSPPGAASIAPAAAVEKTPVTIAGHGFGRAGTPGAAVTFARPGMAPVPAQTTAWSPNAITAVVPNLTALGTAGLKDVVVHTPWGDSEPVQFELGELPVIESIGPPQAAPGAPIAINGHAFGTRPPGKAEIVAVFEGEDETSTDTVTSELAITSWSDFLINAMVPTLGVLRSSGVKQVLVTTRWGTGDPHQLVVGDRGSITAWTRVEVHARDDDLDAGLATGLQAAVYDARWLVGRQWQMREFDGEDAGSPILARVDGETCPIARWRPGIRADTPALPVPDHVPLETLVEHEQILPPRDGRTTFDDRRLAVESGLHWLRVLSRHLSHPNDPAKYRRRYLQWVPMQPPDEQERRTLDAATLRYLDLMAGRAPDGARLYWELQQALAENGRQIPKKPPIEGNDRDGFFQAVDEWYAWWDGLFSQATGAGDSWTPARMEYGFELAADTSGGELVLSAPEYDGRRLDWYSVSADGGESLRGGATAAQPVRFQRTLVPVPVSFPGMPAPRFWEIEDAAVDFGGVRAGPTDLVRLLFVEFATVFGNDWFTVPLDGMPVGCLCRIDGLVVTDTFGRQTEVTPLADSVDGFRMFDLGGRPDLLFVADALPSTIESPPLEEVLILRDELANLAWGVERVIAGAAGRPVNRLEVWQRQAEEMAAGETAPATGSPDLAYRFATTVPDYWIPFVLKVEEVDGQPSARWLARASLRDPQTGEPIRPMGEVLEHASAQLRIYDEVVPRDGIQLRRTWQYGRAPDGSTHLWRTRRRDTGRGEGSSGLRFDVLERRRVMSRD
jgi:IPT/TIG domain